MSGRCIGLLTGPNLNLVGERNPEIYGGIGTLRIEQTIAERAASYGLRLWAHQSNSEGGLVSAVQAARWSCAGMILNPGAFTHTSIALRDALELFRGPIVEVHLSDINAREAFRRHSYVKDLAACSILGKGPAGYLEALDYLTTQLPPP